MSHVALQRFLNRLLLRSQLSASDRAAVLKLPFAQQRVDLHRDVIVPGTTVEHCLLVASGWAARFDQLASGYREIVAVYLPGDMCDLHSLAVPTAGWGIQALGNTEFLQVPHASLRTIVERSPDLGRAFWRDTTADASILAKWVCNRGRRQSLRRLAHLLCELGIRSEQAGTGTRTLFELRATQNQLAEMLGVTPVHTNRVLQMVRQSQLVSTVGTMIHVHDWEKLVRLGEFDPAYLLLDRIPERSGSAGRLTVTASE